MSVSQEYAEWLQDVLRPLGHIRLRRMFGGFGIYADELFFALVVEEQLYFKVDARSRPVFEAEGLEEWVYLKEGKPVHMNYFRPPEAIFDEEDELLRWGRLALAAALRARKPGTKASASGLKQKAEKTAAKKTSVGKSRAGSRIKQEDQS
ncbi:MAG: TfoX/Sxy family protein [Moraxellaceae bacterium]